MFRTMIRRGIGLLAGALLTALAASPTLAETRVALVLGAGGYATNPMPNALNDAGLVARTLRDLGFSTVEGADLTSAEVRQAVAEFIGKLREAGPDSVAIVYLAGLGLQHESDSYFIPSDVAVSGEADVPIGGVRIADIARAIAAVPSKARVVLLDLSRDHPYAAVGRPVGPGLGVIDGAPGLLIASAAAPGQVSVTADQAYGRFATALAEQLAAPGVPLDEAVARARLRVHQLTNGRDTPWEVSALQPPVPVLNAGETTGSTPPPAPPLAERPMEGLSSQEAYALAIERDSIEGYQAFLRIHPDDPLAARIKRLLAAKREALVWRRTTRVGSAQAYWTYLRRYPRGPHSAEARWRLERLQVAVAPPADFVEVVYEDIPPPLPVVEVVYDPIYWEPAPPAFYDEVIIAPSIYLGPPIAPVYALPPPPPPIWGVLPVVAAAAIIASPIVIQRFVRPRVQPVVLTPRAGPRIGLPPGGRPGGFPGPGGAGGPGFRPLPGGAGGAALPGGGVRPGPGVIQPPGARLAPGNQPGMINPAPRGPNVGAPQIGRPGGPQIGRPGGPGVVGRGIDPNTGRRVRDAGIGNQPIGGPNAGPRRGGAFRGPVQGNVRPQMQPRPNFQQRPNFQPRIQQRPQFQSRPSVQPRMQARPSFQAPRMQAPRPSFQAPRASRPAAPNIRRRP
ncbi:MAG: caspase family protein [Proteobacteria bacterium]|nr:caspase family protein [Pseudomonadota bacterium]